MGDSNQAAGHFDDSLSLCRRSARQPELAWICCDYAEMLLDRNDSVDREKAVTLLDESLAISGTEYFPISAALTRTAKRASKRNAASPTSA